MIPEIKRKEEDVISNSHSIIENEILKREEEEEKNKGKIEVQLLESPPSTNVAITKKAP